MGTSSRFHIKNGYRENPRPVYFLDDPKGEITFQPDVIPRAEALAVERGVDRIIDVGCGWAEKLAALHARRPAWSLVGVDYGDNLAHCRESYDWGEWIELDLERPFTLDAAESVIICSDVIEHLADPTAMLESFRVSGARYVVFSTPERDVQYGPNHRGPSPNLCHIREWNLGELYGYITASGFIIEEAALMRGNDAGPALTTSLIIARPT